MTRFVVVAFFLFPILAKADDSILDPSKTESLRLFAGQICEYVRNKDFKGFRSSYAQLSDYEFEAKKGGLRTDSTWAKRQYPKLEKFAKRQNNDWLKLSDLFLFEEDRSWFLLSSLHYIPVAGKSNVYDVFIRLRYLTKYYTLTIKDCTFSGNRWYINQGILLESTNEWYWP
jgi:hypothetical protein